jgi:hypothetical protein
MFKKGRLLSEATLLLLAKEEGIRTLPFVSNGWELSAGWR